MIIPEQIEREWRVSLTDEEWFAALSQAKGLCDDVTQARVTDLVFGRFGEQSVERDGWVVRVRLDTKPFFELKRKLNATDWSEQSVAIDAPDTMVDILRQMGLSPHLLLDRERTTMSGGRWRLMFDDFPLLGKFVEVEELTSSDMTHPLDELVAELSQRASVPAYGAVVRARACKDMEFAEAMRAAIASHRFSA